MSFPRRLKRIQSELKMFNSKSSTDLTETTGISIDIPDESNISKLTAYITGPKDTPYEGGRFNLQVKFPPNYPFVAPKIYFATKIWHPNISSVTGTICLNILSEEWVPSLTLYTGLLSIRALLSNPEPKDPQDAVVASQYLHNYNQFVSTAKYWTLEYANCNDFVENNRPVITSQSMQNVGSGENNIGQSSSSGSLFYHFPLRRVVGKSNLMEDYPEKDDIMVKFKSLHNQLSKECNSDKNLALETLSANKWDIDVARSALRIELNSSNVDLGDNISMNKRKPETIDNESSKKSRKMSN